ncbi:MAG TPA: DUF721 domain-containing protein [Opitutaceae bacterium]|nr:DUF721 domain-containing protein [Opitutaceae bacterium]
MAQEPIPFSRAAEELIGEFRGVPFNEPARMRKRPTQPLASLIEDLLVKHRIGRASPEDALRERWPALVGPANASYSHAAYIDARGRLTILAAHAVVRHEIFLHRATILARVRAVPGCGHVREVIVRAG